MQENNSFNEEQTAAKTTEDILCTKQINTSNICEEYNPEFIYSGGIPTKKQGERKEIKKAAQAAGISLLIFNIFAYFLAAVFFIILVIISGNNISKASQLEVNPAIIQLRQIIFSTCLFTLPVVSVYKLYKYRISDLVSFKLPEKQMSAPLILFGISFCAFANIATSIAGDFFDNFGVQYEVTYNKEPQGFWGFMLSLIAAVIVPAIVEEFACRGIILGSLRRFGDGFSIITSAVLFGLLHGNFEQMPFAFLGGLVLGFITIKSGSLLLSMAVHFFNNLIPLLYDHVFDSISPYAQNMSYTLFLILSLLLGILALKILKGRTTFYCFKERKTESAFSEKIKWFFLSVPVLIFVIVSIFESTAYFV